MVRRSIATVGMLALSLSIGGCDIVDPCDLETDEEAVNKLDRTWRLTTVNGAPIPAGGFPIPLSNEKLLSGTLNFQTTGRRGSCKAEADSHITYDGRVVAVYNLATSSGAPKDSKTYAGSFEYERRAGRVKLKAEEKYEITGVRLLNELRFQQGLGIKDYTLIFVKAP